MEELPSFPEEKKLPAPEEKLLRAPTFGEKYGKFRWLILSLLLFLIFVPVLILINKPTAPQQSTQLPTPTQPLLTSLPTPTADPTASWKTYKTADFSFKYSPTAVIEQKTTDEFVLGIEYTPSNYFDFMTVRSKQVPFSTPVVEGNKPGDIDQVDKNFINIDGKQVENYIVHCNAADCYYKKTYFSVGKNYYELTFDIAGGGLGALSGQILSTFKFLDQTVDTSNWKTYTNNKFTFSIKYPSTAQIEEYPQNSESAPIIGMKFPDIDKYTLFALFISDTYPTRDNPKEIIDILISQDLLDKTRKIKHTRSTYTVDNIEGEKVISDVESSSSKYGDANVVIVNFLKEYNFGIRYYQENKDKVLQRFDQILSTFKLTEK